MYALPYELYEKYKIRRYGFHGTSHKYVTQQAAEMLGKDVSEVKLVTCHLGNGGSLTAVDGGKSVDTTMGFTPLAGVVMGTRCGDIDPAIVNYIAEKEGINGKEVDTIMNKKSGVLGLSGKSSDFRDLWDARGEGNERAGMALDCFHYSVAKNIGSYLMALGGADAIVFTAGLGENSTPSRAAIGEYLKWLGITIDPEQNGKRGENLVISTPDSKIKVLVIPTNEELMIAKDTKALCSK
jgi:acetate kinase